MSADAKFYDFVDYRSQSSLQRSSYSSSTFESDETGLAFWDPSYTPVTTPPTSDRQLSNKSSSDTTTTLDLEAPVTISFTKGSKLFKLKYAKIDVCKDTAGGLRCIELSDSVNAAGPFVHTFTNSRRPIPHLEQPATPTQRSLRISFLEDQTVQTAQTVFNTQPRYAFEKLSDCNRFQEEVLGQSLLFVAGVAEVSSKGRGEEAISQNLRVLKSKTGSISIVYFANSQRKEKKRYTSIALDSIDSGDQPKKSGKPVHLKLIASNELSTQLKSLSITFLDQNDAKRFCIIIQGAGVNLKLH